jgi:polar amino acid transport system substrate-binding protein
MEQFTQKLRDGSIRILEAPVPAPGPGMVLVKNHFSLISAGTEASTVKTARKGLVGKAKERPQQVKQVIDVLRSQGPVQTYRAVMKKLDAHSPLGYSCAGEVIAVGPGVTGFKVGDLAACGGASAGHAEVVAVPRNLCVKLAPDADLKKAAYNTLGAIALQGVRQADLRLGESCAVIGLGLLGQLACQLLQASGVRVVGIDVSEAMVELAAKGGAHMALTRSEPGIESRINDFTEGLGCDAVIIAAGTDSLDPVNFAGAVARKRGVVVVLGAVPTGFDREPHYYRKELSLRMSCSYGPGRYDPEYEDKGRDYPPAYVRWTENRNMRAFQEALYSGKVEVSHLTTHVFPLQEAAKAYDMIVERSEPSVGVLVEYDASKEHEVSGSRIRLKETVAKTPNIAVGFIGAGSYAQSHLLPNLPKGGDVVLKGVMTATSAGARSAGDRYGFEFCTTDAGEILENDEINTVFIATRHDTHAEYVLRALQAGKHVFVEKPLCLSREELERIRETHEAAHSRGAASLLMVGYNRRFSPLLRKTKASLGHGPKAAIYRVNAGAIPRESWIQDMEVGGGRIIGEVCHFVDCLVYLTGSLPSVLQAFALRDPDALLDSVAASLSFSDGSVGSVNYLANGDKSMSKERLEVFCGGASAVMDDYRSLVVHKGGKAEKKKLTVQDKGQKAEVAAFLEAVKSGGPPPIAFEELYGVSAATFGILESIIENRAVGPSEDAAGDGGER